jgi:drug/metabolite transporter (DMT)-like permease
MDQGDRQVSNAGSQRCVLIESMAAQKNGKTGGKGAPVGALLFLCALWSAESLQPELLPFHGATGEANQLERQALLFALLAIPATLVALMRRAKWPRGRELGACVVAGIGLFVVPPVLVHLGSNWVSDGTRVALFSLVPVFAVVFEPHFGRLAAPQSRSGLMAALVAVAGTLLVFPVDLPESLQAGSAFCALVIAAACVAAANCRAVRIASEEEGISTWTFAAVAGAASAIALALSGVIVDRSAWTWRGPLLDLAWFAGVGLPGLLLLFWLFQRMSAARMTTRFLIAPLIANLIGLIILRPTVGLRGWAGLLLVATGAAWLLFGPEEFSQPTTTRAEPDRN